MRKALFHLLTTDSVLIAAIPADRWYERSSVPDSPSLPFAVLAYDGKLRVGTGLRSQRASLWVYQGRGDYGFISTVLERAFVVLEGVINHDHDGERLVQVIPGNISSDLYDDLWRANTQNLEMIAIGTSIF
jgi:hypothetical protein